MLRKKRGVGEKGWKEPEQWMASFHCLVQGKMGRKERGRDEESPPRAQTFSSSQLWEDYGRETTESKNSNVFSQFYEGWDVFQQLCPSSFFPFFHSLFLYLQLFYPHYQMDPQCGIIFYCSIIWCYDKSQNFTIHNWKHKLQ